MTALAEALVAAQRRALSVLQKAYVAGTFDADVMREHLETIGCTDGVDQEQLIQSLEVLRTFGGSLPAETKPAEPQAEPKATAAQVSYAQSLFAKSGAAPLAESDLRSLPLAQMTKLIDQLKSGTYDAGAWDVPF